MQALQAFLYLFPFYIVFCLIPMNLYIYYRKKYFLKYANTKQLIDFVELYKTNKFFNLVSNSVIEEIIFRYFPYSLFGLFGLIPSSIFWAYLHVPTREQLKELQIVCFAYYLSAAIFFIYAIIVSIFMPFVYHIIHNCLCYFSEIIYSKNFEKEMNNPEFVKNKNENETIRKNKEIVKIKFPYEFLKSSETEIETIIENITDFEFTKRKVKL